MQLIPLATTADVRHHRPTAAVLPVGSFEQHGDNLPLSTDTLIASATLTKVATQIPVVLTSRTASGPVLAETYGFPGSERDLISRGLIPAGLLDPFKARILLHMALAAGADRDQVLTAFTAAGGLGSSHGWPWPTDADLPAHAMAGGA